jgi:hypothetical protein
VNGNAHHGGPPDDTRSRRKGSAAPRRIGWRAANRIVSGKDGGPRADGLRALITVASMPKQSPATSTDRAHAEAEPAGREAMLAAYRESATDGEPGAWQRRGNRSSARKGASGRHTSLALVLRFTTAVLLVCGVGAAAASAGVLPAGVQRIARDYFGIGGASAPATHVSVPSSSAVITGPPKSSGGKGNGAAAPSSAARSNAAPASSDVITALCHKISQNDGDWELGVDAAGQAALITAAGDEHKVRNYCAQLLANGNDGNGNGNGSGGNGNGNGLTPLPAASPKGLAASSKPSPVPSAEPTGPHGKTHVSHSPAAHGAD